MTKMHGMAVDWNCYGRHGGAYWESLITMQIGMALGKNGKKSSGPKNKHKVKKTFPWMRMLRLRRDSVQRGTCFGG